MPVSIWTLAKLSPEQERLVKEAEAALGGGAILAYAKGEVNPSPLTPVQIQALRALEQKMGLVLVAVKPG
ncbi:MAG: hypothetical protein HY675_26495 [Chloroflexi bacterium]|nr:hypothetical protein [Chloroflexota bacterium]